MPRLALAGYRTLAQRALTAGAWQENRGRLLLSVFAVALGVALGVAVHLINGSAELMKAFLWPMLDNKFLKHPGLGLKFMLPLEFPDAGRPG